MIGRVSGFNHGAIDRREREGGIKKKEKRETDSRI